MKVYGAYLENYHFIKVIIPKSFSLMNIKLIGNNDEIDLFNLVAPAKLSIMFDKSFSFLINNVLTKLNINSS